MKKKVVLTKNKEIYEKLNNLHFMDEVILKNNKNLQINRILKNINRHGDVLTKEKIGDYILLKKISNFDFSIYFNKN